MKFEECYCFECKKNFYVREDQPAEECPTCSGGDIEVTGFLLDAKELYFTLRYDKTLKRVIICSNINEMINEQKYGDPIISNQVE